MQALKNCEENPQTVCDISAFLNKKYRLNIYQVSKKLVRRTYTYKETTA